MSEIQITFYYLGVALAIGLLIGLERGWKSREAKEGERVAGIRTYGLIGLLGGGTALIAEKSGPLILGMGFIAVAGILTAVYIVNLRRENADIGITSLTTGLLTFVLGALAVMGEVAVATAFAVVITLLLSYKPLLHRWVSVLEAKELFAILKLLLISVVLLPILPNKGYGPQHALNPYMIWWMVVLIAAISFIGYFAIKIAGARRGAVFTGIFGGLASSTALTLHFSRMSRNDTAMAPVWAMGILLACGTMFPRILLVASILNFNLFMPLIFPVSIMALITYLPALLYWRFQPNIKTDAVSPLSNPLELKAALSFGILLATVMLLSKTLQYWFGSIGIWVLSAVSGIADVDAITLSLSRMSQNNLTIYIAVIGIVIAASTNNLVKCGLVAVIGGRKIAFRVGLPLIGSSIGGLLATWLWVR